MQLAKHPEIQTKVREELRAHPDTKTEHLPYFRRVLKESMRIVPVGAMGSIRTTGREIEHQGLVIPQGAAVFLPQILPMRDPKVFTNPDDFDPDRWESPTTAMNEAYLPFSLGVRNCPGQSLATSEMYTVLPLILQEYELELVDEGRLDYFLTLKYADARIRAKRIHQ